MARHWATRLVGRRRAGPAVDLPAHVRISTDVGPLLLQAHDQLMTALIPEQGGRWEVPESEQLRAWLRPGMTFLDIGAHVGYMSLLGAAAVGPAGTVIAVEASPPNAALLRANLAANRAANVEVVEAAASDRSGRVELSLSPWNTGDNRAYPVPEMERVEVPAVRLDDVLGGRRVDVVKVDTQGTDHRALRGLSATLARWRPPLVVEFWPHGIRESGDDPGAVLAQYAAMCYEVRVLGGREDGPSPSDDEVMGAALSAGGDEFCTLVLRPPAA